jgi:hypothetical protein
MGKFQTIVEPPFCFSACWLWALSTPCSGPIVRDRGGGRGRGKRARRRRNQIVAAHHFHTPVSAVAPHILTHQLIQTGKLHRRAYDEQEESSHRERGKGPRW